MELNNQEIAELQHLQDVHAKVVAQFGTLWINRHIRAVMLSGNISWRVMKIYCESHGTKCPSNWPEFT